MKQSTKLFSVLLRDCCGQETDRLAGFLQVLNSYHETLCDNVS
jgi:hypothetical protein